MYFVLISVFCSVTVAVMLKYARSISIDTRQIIVWNYPAAVLLTYLFFKPDFTAVSFTALPWILYLPVSIILPSLFVILSLSLRYAGLVQTEIAQRISLVLSLTAAVWIFEEAFSVGRIVGIVLGFVSILFLIGWQRGESKAGSLGKIVYPLLVFVGYGMIDILFKKVAMNQVVPYTTAMFVMFSGALLVGFIYLLYILLVEKSAFSLKSGLWGLALGTFNFGNILFYMKAHQVLSDSPSIVFTGMNIGVITLGSLIGVWFFNEKLSLFNKIGVFFAVIAVLLIAYL